MSRVEISHGSHTLCLPLTDNAAEQGFNTLSICIRSVEEDALTQLVDGGLRNGSQPCDGVIRMTGTTQGDEHVSDRFHGPILILKRIELQYVSEFHTNNSPTYSCEMDIKDILAALMNHHKISQNYLAEVTGVPQPTIYRILNGSSKEPRNSNVKKLASYFGISAAQLLGEEPMPGLQGLANGTGNPAANFGAIDVTSSKIIPAPKSAEEGYKALQAGEVKADLSKRTPEELMLIIKIASDLLYKKSGL
ncbi:helix-turn-helix transcriptional regulator [Aquitalea sp. ASV11]|uniref:helix-turn-helix domain-containing protein n=1 Tax=Aquitalea sp. ASV11 TaxID=2795103 RepID=UPI0018ED743C|nr:helix-turn-helix transcriptional regulator [Aquitalea sp. ASV11]